MIIFILNKKRKNEVNYGNKHIHQMLFHQLWFFYNNQQLNDEGVIKIFRVYKMNIEHKLVIDNDKQQVKFHLVNQVAKQVTPFSERKGYTAVKKCSKFVCLSQSEFSMR
jgi:hypothetical protein